MRQDKSRFIPASTPSHIEELEKTNKFRIYKLVSERETANLAAVPSFSFTVNDAELVDMERAEGAVY